MSYQDTLDYLFSGLPMYHRTGIAAYKADLCNITAICDISGNPHKNFKSVHIAGTNGKGSVSHFLASILQESGFKTGLFTSPHLIDFRERIRVNGKKIPEEKVINFVERYRTTFDSIKPSFFEWTAGLAFSFFSEEKVDIAIIETGLGGRLDSTNIISPELSVITNIGLDHTNLLGDTLNKIAAEKAGIIKDNVPVVIGQTQEEVKDVFIEKARKHYAPVFFADTMIEVLKTELLYGKYPRLQMNLRFVNEKIPDKFSGKDIVVRSPLTGLYQKKNIVTAVIASKILCSSGIITDAGNIIKGIAGVVENTELMGRWQKLSDFPAFICDTAHNVDGIKEVLQQISSVPHNKLHIVLGFVNDKDTDSVLQLMPAEADYYFCKASVPRALDENILAEKAKGFSLKGKSFSTVKDACNAAISSANTDDLIFAGGSTFVVADVLCAANEAEK